MGHRNIISVGGKTEYPKSLVIHTMPLPLIVSTKLSKLDSHWL